MAQVIGTYNYQTPYYYELGVGRSPGATLWERFPLQAALTDPHTYVVYNNDFLECTVGTNTIPGWTFTSVTSGAITQDATNPNGVMLIDAGAVTANQGVNWSLNVLPFKIAASKPVAMEFVFSITGLSTTPKIQFFGGLSEASTAIIASGAFATVNRVGFQSISTTGVVTSVARQAGTAATGTGVTVATDVVYRLGFYATSTQVDFYLNGSIVSSATTQIPTGPIAPIFSMKANATVTPVLNLDSVMVAGYRI